ncbi:MAG: carbohydrate binding domain-containing protein [Anaerohalosphaeraceae bacterium]
MKKMLVFLCVACLVSAANANLIGNGGFESPIGTIVDNWSVNAIGNTASVTRVTGNSYNGSYAAEFIVNYISETGTKAEILQQTLTGSIIPGQAYDFSFYAKGLAGPGVVGFYQVQWLDSDGSNGGGVKGVTPMVQFGTSLTSVYQRFGFIGQTAAAGADAAFISIRLEGGAFVGSIGNMLVDKAVLTPEPAGLILLGLGGLVIRRRK